eukprot:5682715-Amphidinium_carterae.1
MASLTLERPRGVEYYDVGTFTSPSPVSVWIAPRSLQGRDVFSYMISRTVRILGLRAVQFEQVAPLWTAGRGRSGSNFQSDWMSHVWGHYVIILDHTRCDMLIVFQ